VAKSQVIAFCRFLIFIYIRRKEMTRPDKDEEREERIHMEIIVDAYDSEEQAMSWHTYLSDTLQFPFSARCIVHRVISPLEKGEEIEVVGMAPDEECQHEMFVLIRWKSRKFAIPLRQLEGFKWMRRRNRPLKIGTTG
jgi:Calcium binding